MERWPPVCLSRLGPFRLGAISQNSVSPVCGVTGKSAARRLGAAAMPNLQWRGKSKSPIVETVVEVDDREDVAAVGLRPEASADAIIYRLAKQGTVLKNLGQLTLRPS